MFGDFLNSKWNPLFQEFSLYRSCDSVALGPCDYVDTDLSLDTPIWVTFQGKLHKTTSSK